MHKRSRFKEIGERIARIVRKFKIAQWSKQLTHRDWTVRQKAVEALGSYQDVQATQAILSVLEDPHPSVRWSAVVALGDIGDVQAAIEPLIQRLHDKSWGVRAKAAEMLGTLASAKAFEPLALLLHDSQHIVREDALRALGKIDASRILPFALKGLIDEDIDIRHYAANHLSHVLRNATRQIQQHVRQELHRMGVTEALIHALKHPHAPIHEDAVRVLCALYSAVTVIIFGTCQAMPEEPCTVLINPDVYNLSLPMPHLRCIMIDAATAHVALVERFITYAVNALGQHQLKHHVDVEIYRRDDNLHPNLQNALTHLCKRVSVHIHGDESRDSESFNI